MFNRRVGSNAETGRARELARAVEVGLDAPICLACLSFVSMAFDEGDPRPVAREGRRIAPDLWDEGLGVAAIGAARRAARAGDRLAQAALDALEAEGGRSPVARALVERLGAGLSAKVHRDIAVWRTAAAADGPGGAPELN